MVKKGATKTEIFSEDEREAMKEYVKEKTDPKSVGEAAVLEKIEKMVGNDRKIAERVHAILKNNAPELTPKTWYGMPAYANKDGKAICFFQDSGKFKTRYSILGFSDLARLDDGSMWPTSYAIKEITKEVEKKIIDLVSRAIS